MKKLNRLVGFSIPFAVLLVIANTGFSQVKPQLTPIQKVKLFEDLKLKSMPGEGGMPNGMPVTPQLVDRVFKSRNGFDGYRMKDGMICITPDSATAAQFRMPNARVTPKTYSFRITPEPNF